MTAPRSAVVDLGRHSTWRVQAGTATVYRPCSVGDVVELVTTRGEGDSYVLGAGSNTLLGIQHRCDLPIILTDALDTSLVLLDRDVMHVGASVMLPRLTRFAAANGISGIEFLAGIPGTVGGAVAMNAGIGGPDGPALADVLVAVNVVDMSTGELVTITAPSLTFGYRQSFVDGSPFLVTSVVVRGRGDRSPTAVHRATRRRLDVRRAKQPLGKRTAGSVFLPVAGRPAGELIEAAGLKGLRADGARVSPLHANWIEADPGCTPRQIQELIDRVVAEVRRVHGIELELEVRSLPGTAHRVPLGARRGRTP